MTKDLFAGIAGLLIGVLVVSGAHAQGIARATGLYDPQTVTTLTGTVIAIRPIAPQEIAAGGIVVVLQTPRETVPVYVYPQTYIASEGFLIQVNDPGVTVTGSRITFSDTGTTAIIAAEVTTRVQVLRLRDVASGVPFF